VRAAEQITDPAAFPQDCSRDGRILPIRKHMLADDRAIRRRGDAIERLGVLKRSGDSGLGRLCRLTAYVTGAGAAAVHILDETQQHRVASTGAPLGNHPCEDSMCRLVVDGDERIVCADAGRDDRFGYSSLDRDLVRV
jgi:hypothetical protein